MEKEPDSDSKKTENTDPLMDSLADGVKNLYLFRDLFFENYPIEKAADKNKLVEDQMNVLMEKFEEIDENQLQPAERATFLYLKGRAYNVGPTYDPRATQCLSKAVKLNPRLVDAWNELGESYWKNKNIKEAKSSFEGALKHERNRISLRCLSIILRQDTSKNPSENVQAIEKSVELAKEAVALDLSDGVSWSALGNAQLCRFFLVAQQPRALAAGLAAYRRARADRAAAHLPDLHYNTAVALKYNEQYKEALESFTQSCRLDPSWNVPAEERTSLLEYLAKVDDLVRTRGRSRGKKIAQMAQSIDTKMLGHYSEGLQLVPLSELVEGENPGKIVLGKVVGSVLSDNLVPFTFALLDSAQSCVAVTVYNWAARGVLIGDCVAAPAPRLARHQGPNYNFKSIRVNNPMTLLVNGKRVGRDQLAGTRVTSTYEIH